MNDVKTDVLGIFPQLPYAYDALEPQIDRATMELHHSKHMRAYYDNAMKASGQLHEAHAKGDLQQVEEQTRIFYNNCGGFYNHQIFFWQMTPKGRPLDPAHPLAISLIGAFGSVEAFCAAFEAAGLSHFGSGWVWLVKNRATKALSIETTPNQDPPKCAHIPIIGIDLWEHAYYLKYQNRRTEYLKALWALLDWQVIGDRFVNS